MKNIEKYPNTKDALAAYNNLDHKTVSFAAWLECKYEETREPTLLEAAQEVTRTLDSQWDYGHLSVVKKAVRNLSLTIKREKRKPVRNYEKYRSVEEALAAYRNMCRGNLCDTCPFGGNRHDYAGCSINWLYAEAKGETK